MFGKQGCFTVLKLDEAYENRAALLDDEVVGIWIICSADVQPFCIVPEAIILVRTQSLVFKMIFHNNLLSISKSTVTPKFVQKSAANIYSLSRFRLFQQFLFFWELRYSYE